MVATTEEENYYILDNLILSCCEHLRKLFKIRWKDEVGEQWQEDSKKMVTELIDKLGAPAFAKCKHLKTSILNSTITEDWDLSILTLVFLNLGDIEKCKIENEAIQQLKEIRNDLAHHSTKKVSKQKFNSYQGKIKVALISLNMTDMEYSKLKENVGASSSQKAFETAQNLWSKAKMCLDANQVAQAIQHYSDAINVPSLLPRHLSEAYQNRAECFLLLTSEIENNDYIENALLDAEKALVLYESWKSHFTCAKCYGLKNDPEKTMYHFQCSLSISPGQSRVKTEYEEYKILQNQQMNHLYNKEMWPLTYEEVLQKKEQKGGISQTMAIQAFQAPGQICVSLGVRHFAGWEVKMDMKMAGMYFSKAAELKNAEGMYCLGLCYCYGYGVCKDVEKGFKIFLETASMNKKSPGITNQLKCNIGVSGSQNSIGVCYLKGIYVEKDYVEAAKWFRKSMENGCSLAAQSLGTMYYEGTGVAKDFNWAELCWKQAVALGDIFAPDALVKLYLEHLEPDLALTYKQIGQKVGSNWCSRQSDSNFNSLVSKIRLERQESEQEVEAFEKQSGLRKAGLLYSVRLQRYHTCQFKFLESLQNYIKVISEPFLGKDPESGGNLKRWDDDTVCTIVARALGGSETAKRHLITYNWKTLTEKCLQQISHDSKVAKLIEVVNLLYKALTLECHIVNFTPELTHKLNGILRKLMEKYGKTKSEMDKKVRYCFAVFALRESSDTADMYACELLKEGLHRYPECKFYYVTLSWCLCNKCCHSDGRKYAELGLNAFPNDPDLLFVQASALGAEWSNDLFGIGQKKEDWEDLKTTLFAFCQHAPDDHRKLPEAYYMICKYFALMHIHGNASKDSAKQFVEIYYRKGLQAEARQLPCYLPYGKISAKFFVDLYLKDINELLNEFHLTPEIPSNVLERKPYLKSPTRKGYVCVFRHFILATSKTKKDNWALSSDAAKFKQICPKRLSMMTQIYIAEMDPTDDHIYENRILELTLMDDILTFFVSIQLLAEDSNGDVIKVCIYNLTKTEENLKKFGAGSRIAILNPYLRVAKDLTVGIRVDDTKCIIYLSKIANMCRFCGEGNVVHKCSTCKRPYCSRECQQLDWKEMKHKLVCKVSGKNCR